MNDLFTKPDYSLYSNAMTFMRRPLVQNPIDNNADVVVLGAPLDMATSGRPGARMGPDAIRRASVNLAWPTFLYLLGGNGCACDGCSGHLHGGSSWSD